MEHCFPLGVIVLPSQWSAGGMAYVGVHGSGQKTVAVWSVLEQMPDGEDGRTCRKEIVAFSACLYS